MAQPRVPGSRDTELQLACGQTVDVRRLNVGMREYACDCGATHAVVMDPHPPERFLPGFLIDILRDAIETADQDRRGEFGTTHLMGLVMEEFPEAVASADASEVGDVGFALVWMTDFDARRLHEIVVELVIELMEHAVSHADSEASMTEFEEQMLQFDVTEFVEQYRAERDLTADDVPGYERG
ncbi:MAG: DUF5815 family protein [Halobacteriales archaeon]